ncbi:MAG: FkbM family methyltransferase [Candidatus Woesearchaeota archaeon]
MKIVQKPFKYAYKLLEGRGLSKISFVKSFYNYIYPKVIPERIVLKEIQGNKMHLDLNDKIVSTKLFMNNIWEETETKLFKDMIQENMTVIDIGAHIGYYTLIAAKLIGKKGKVYSFEPNPDNFALLKKNIEENGYKNVTLINKAISNKKGFLKLFINPESSGGASIYEKENAKYYTNIIATTLDESLKNIKKIDIIKMDIEGAEILALEGMSNIIKRNKNIKLIIEFNPEGIKKLGYEPINLINKLKNFGFTIKVIDEKNKSIIPVEYNNIIFNNKESINLLCEK